jgi:hypothetical protein
MDSMFKKIVYVLVILILIFVVFYLVVTKVLFSPVYTETLYSTSPDGKVDVVLITRDVGAMASTRYSLYLIPHGQKHEKNGSNAVFVAHRVFDLNVTWEDNCKLLIRYSSADINHFQNNYYPFYKGSFHENDDQYYLIRIREQEI